ncbi:MAG: hypothetical protein GY861_20260 [bacterium]|nr:hypothetical protein [bacterium]
MQYTISFHVPLEEHFQALKYDDNQREAAKSILEDSDALIEEKGVMYISIQKYMEYVLSLLEDIGQSAIESKSLKDFEGYGSVTRGNLDEWTIIIGNLCYVFANDEFTKISCKKAESLRKLMNDMRTIFEHVVTAHELFIEFGLEKGKSDPVELEKE